MQLRLPAALGPVPLRFCGIRKARSCKHHCSADSCSDKRPHKKASDIACLHAETLLFCSNPIGSGFPGCNLLSSGGFLGACSVYFMLMETINSNLNPSLCKSFRYIAWIVSDHRPHSTDEKARTDTLKHRYVLYWRSYGLNPCRAAMRSRYRSFRGFLSCNGCGIFAECRCGRVLHMRHASIPAHSHILGYRASMFRLGGGGTV